MHIIYSLFLSFLLTFILGCGGGSTTTPEDPAVSIKEPVKSAAGIFTVGDDQNVLVGDTVSLTISQIDKETTLDKFTWKEGETILGITEALDTNKLTPGKHEITVEVVDSQGHTYADTVTVTIKEPVAENSRPLAKDITLHTEEDSSITTALQGSDNEGDALSYLLISQPNHGTLRGSAARLVYTPDANYYGEDSFRYKTNDGTIDSNLATVSILVTAVDDAPVATNQNVSLLENTNKTITLAGTDAESDSLTYAVVTLPSHGTYDGTTYTPTANYFGNDSFTFKANDGKADSAPATVSIMINAVNDAPIAIDDFNSTNEDTNITFNLLSNDTDVDTNANLTLIDINNTVGFSFSGDGNLTFSPTNRYDYLSLAEEQNITITYTIADEHNATSEAIATITIRGLDDIVSVDTINTQESNLSSSDGNISGQITASDPDSTITYIDNNNSNGFNINASGHYTFNPPTGLYNYLSEGEQAIITIPIMIGGEAYNIPITIIGQNDAPTVQNKSTTIPNDTNATFTLSAEDIDSTSFTYEILSADVNGTHTLVDNTFTYAPDAGSSGTIVYDYRAVDDFNATSNTGTLTIHVGATNIAPVAEDMNITLQEDNSKVIELNASDANGDSLSFFTGATTLHGNLTLAGGQASYQPTANFHGTDSFTYYVQDSLSTSNTATVTINITSVNDTPVANPDNNTTNEDTNITFNILANDSDVDANATLTLIDVNATEGNFTFNPEGNLTFSPIGYFDTLSAGEEHNVTLYYTMQDEFAASAEANVTITITGINDEPIAHFDYNETNEDTNISFNLLNNDIDVDNNAMLTLVDVNATSGNVTFSFTPNGELTFSPIGDFDSLNENQEESVSFSYRIQDEYNATSEANISIIVRGENDTPSISSITPILLDENNLSATGQIASTDIDNNTTLTYESNSSLLQIDTNGTYTFNTTTNYDSLAEGATEIIPIMITISDGNTNITQEINATIIGVNTPPTVEIGGDYNITQNEIIVFGITSSGDVDGSITQYSWKLEGTEVSTNTSFEHNFTTAGIYNVTLTVTDDKNATGEDSLMVYVSSNTSSDEMFIPHPVTNNAPNNEWLEMVDIDLDGDLDILTAGDGGTKVGWYENRGDGNFTFTEHVITTTGSEPESIKATDIDDDGDLDILYTTYDGGASLMQCINDGSQSFTSCEAIPNITDGLSFIELVDINNDNYLDIIVTSWINDKIEWYENLQNGAYSSATQINDTEMLKPVSLASVDFNSDGHMDIVAAASDSNKIIWYQNDGDGTGFTEQTITGSVNGAYSVDVADINGDGYDDIISVSNSDGIVYWHENTKSASVSFKTPVAIATYLTSVYYASGADMDNDGDIDIVTASSETNGRIVWYENTGGDNNFTEHNISTGINNIIRVFPADIDNDGNMDVVMGTADGNVTLFENPSTANEKKLLDPDAPRSYTIVDSTDKQDDYTELIWMDDSDVNTNYSAASAFLNPCQQKGNGWREPSIGELFTIVDRNASSLPYIDAIFQNGLGGRFWTSTYEIVDFDTGEIIYYSDDSNDKPLRCVRGNLTESKYIRDDINHVVKDPIRKLMWQDDANANTVIKTTIEDAVATCTALNSTTPYSNWRLPNIQELYSIKEANPSILQTDHNIDIFENTAKKSYWSTTKIPNRNDVYKVSFTTDKSSDIYVRCVRDIP